MQVTETELVIPFKSNTRIRNAVIGISIYIVLQVGLLSYTIVLAAQTTRTSPFPIIREMAYKTMISISIDLFLVLLLYGLITTFAIRQLRRQRSSQLRITHEGVFLPSPALPSALLIRWEEIRELSPFTSAGSPFFGIMTRDTESIIARAKASSGLWLRIGIDINQWIVRRTKSLPSFGVAQENFPIPVNELITAIQEQFAAELQEHHITLQR